MGTPWNWESFNWSSEFSEKVWVARVKWFWKKGSQQQSATKESSASPPAEADADEGASLQWTTSEGTFSHRLKGTITIGTLPSCHIVVNETFPGSSEVRGCHLKIEEWRGRWVAVPNDSDAVVLFNGRRGGETVLRDGVEIRLGVSGPVFSFHSGKSPSR
ncbi:MAG: FHA domain-containing protein [Armatimonadetes bacterium]|nr:FHA domain-containing protein [Armatimonadota bacterium]MDW8121760.1 FHA domain-containing protein [Armatimonadota bacterium]